MDTRIKKGTHIYTQKQTWKCKIKHVKYNFFNITDDKVIPRNITNIETNRPYFLCQQIDSQNTKNYKNPQKLIFDTISN